MAHTGVTRLSTSEISSNQLTASLGDIDKSTAIMVESLLRVIE